MTYSNATFAPMVLKIIVLHSVAQFGFLRTARFCSRREPNRVHNESMDLLVEVWRHTLYYSLQGHHHRGLYRAPGVRLGARERERNREFGKWTVRVFRCLGGSHPSGEGAKKVKGTSEKGTLSQIYSGEPNDNEPKVHSAMTFHQLLNPALFLLCILGMSYQKDSVEVTLGMKHQASKISWYMDVARRC